MIPCLHFGRCGGCKYLDIPYAEELAIKEADLRETLGEYSPHLTELIPAPRPVAYRNKMEIAFGDDGKDGKLALGMRKQRSFYEVATPSVCVLIPPDFSRIIVHVLEYFQASGDAFFHRKRHTGTLRHLVLRRGEFTGQILLLLSTTSGLETPLQPLIDSLLKLELDGQIVGFSHAINDGVADAVKNENITILHGQDYYMEQLLGLKFKVSTFSFFQTNSSGAEVLYDLVRHYAKKAGANNLAYDMYCGTGTIAQILSPIFDKVMGIEIVEEAIEAAKANAKLNHITNCAFFAGDVGKLISTNAIETPDVLVLDPPRDGIHPKTLPQIIDINAPVLIYVACKPKSLVRDLPQLLAAGYVLREITAMDMFPRTPHVEAVALLTRDETL